LHEADEPKPGSPDDQVLPAARKRGDRSMKRLLAGCGVTTAIGIVTLALLGFSPAARSATSSADLLHSVAGHGQGRRDFPGSVAVGETRAPRACIAPTRAPPWRKFTDATKNLSLRA